MDKINLEDKLARITEHWRPKVIGELNGQEVKLVEDELFIGIRGRFRIEFRVTGNVPRNLLDFKWT